MEQIVLLTQPNAHSLLKGLGQSFLNSCSIILGEHITGIYTSIHRGTKVSDIVVPV